MFLKLARHDREAARLWALHVRSVDTVIGKVHRRWCTSFLCRVAAEDPRIARDLVYDLPRAIARVPEQERERYTIMLWRVGLQQVALLSILSEVLVDLLNELEDVALVRFLLHAISLHEKNPQKAKLFLKQSSSESQAFSDSLQSGVSLSEVQPTLTFYARGHCGRSVAIRSGGRHAFTDGMHIYLPDRMDLGLGAEVDTLAYRVLTARNVGYLEFGSMDLILDDIPGDWGIEREEELPLERLFRSFPNTQLAKDLFLIVEHLRIESRIRTEYPGVGRAMSELGEIWRPPRPKRASPQPVEELVEALYLFSINIPVPNFKSVMAEEHFFNLKDQIFMPPNASVSDSVQVMQRCFEAAYGLMRKSSNGESHSDEYTALAGDVTTGALDISVMDESERQRELLVQSTLEELREADENATIETARSVAEDYFSQAEFLERLEAPSGVLREDSLEDEEEASSRFQQSILQEGVEAVGEGILYPEWDMRIDDIKPNWTQVFECQLSMGELDFSAQTKSEFGPEIHKLRRFFESLRPDASSRHYNLEDGDDIDLDRALEARIARRMKQIPSTRIYSANRRQERDTAVAFLVDISSSTNELTGSVNKRILDIEKEALIILSEAIDALGDAFSIYGYSGYSRSQVAFYIAKRFDEEWGEEAQRRVGQLRWMMENRDGAAIRHCTTKLLERSERYRLMILLSDGKPLDCGCEDYADDYAQADTHAAILDARQQGIRVFCITVDPYGQHYLKNLYGEGGYTVIEEVSSLPDRLPAIYHRLTS